MSQTKEQRKNFLEWERGCTKDKRTDVVYVEDSKEISRHLYLSQKALVGETTLEEDKELEELNKTSE